MDRNKQSAIVNLFQREAFEEHHLAKLSLRSAEEGPANGAMQSKKFRHLCYLMECFYAVAIAERNNVTENPTCEWELQMYTANK